MEGTEIHIIKAYGAFDVGWQNELKRFLGDLAIPIFYSRITFANFQHLCKWQDACAQHVPKADIGIKSILK
jgi:hypothetical protein